MGCWVSGMGRGAPQGEGELCRKFISSNIPRNYFIVFPNLSNQMRGDYRTRDVTKMFFYFTKISIEIISIRKQTVSSIGHISQNNFFSYAKVDVFVHTLIRRGISIPDY